MGSRIKTIDRDGSDGLELTVFAEDYRTVLTVTVAPDALAYLRDSHHVPTGRSVIDYALADIILAIDAAYYRDPDSQKVRLTASDLAK
jgi:hypothetical protein